MTVGCTEWKRAWQQSHRCPSGWTHGGGQGGRQRQRQLLSRSWDAWGTAGGLPGRQWRSAVSSYCTHHSLAAEAAPQANCIKQLLVLTFELCKPFKLKQKALVWG